MKRFDPLLKTQPWRVVAVFLPLERVLDGIERDGTVQSVGTQVVFQDENASTYYDLAAAMRGIVEFHELAASRFGSPIDLRPMTRFANKIESSSPLFESDLASLRLCIAECKSQAMRLRLSQAYDILTTVRIQSEISRVSRRQSRGASAVQL